MKIMLLTALPVILKNSLFTLRKPATVLYTRKYASKPIRCDAHMNELPIPCGPWDVYYNDRQAFYSKVLALGAVWWLFSLVMMISTGSFYLNWGPPLQPGPPSEMVEECSDED